MFKLRSLIYCSVLVCYLSNAFLRGYKTLLPRNACLPLLRSKAWNRSSRWADSKVLVVLLLLVLLLLMVVMLLLKERQ